jgi:hypothetical protein
MGGTVPSSRTVLTFNHLPKCAGTELVEVLEACLPAGKLKVVGEFGHTNSSDQKQSFIVGSIREPCSAYLSLWAYGVAGAGMFRWQCPSPALYYPMDRDPSANLHADMFNAWLEGPARAVFQQRFDASFPEPSAVDCWVRVEFLDTDLRRCLKAFEAQGGGPVDWAHADPGLRSLRRTSLEMVSSPGGHSWKNANVRRRLHRKRGTGGAPLHKDEVINPSVHDKCNDYYGGPPHDGRLVMRDQRAIYHAFGYVRHAMLQRPHCPHHKANLSGTRDRREHGAASL